MLNFGMSDISSLTSFSDRSPVEQTPPPPRTKATHLVDFTASLVQEIGLRSKLSLLSTRPHRLTYLLLLSY